MLPKGPSIWPGWHLKRIWYFFKFVLMISSFYCCPLLVLNGSFESQLLTLRQSMFTVHKLCFYHWTIFSEIICRISHKINLVDFFLDLFQEGRNLVAHSETWAGKETRFQEKISHKCKHSFSFLACMLFVKIAHDFDRSSSNEDRGKPNLQSGARKYCDIFLRSHIFRLKQMTNWSSREDVSNKFLLSFLSISI